jgi:hypothetical protein
MKTKMSMKAMHAQRLVQPNGWSCHSICVNLFCICRIYIVQYNIISALWYNYRRRAHPVMGDRVTVSVLGKRFRRLCRLRGCTGCRAFLQLRRPGGALLRELPWHHPRGRPSHNRRCQCRVFSMIFIRRTAIRWLWRLPERELM